MTIQEKLTEQLHTAIKSKNEFERDYIRVILAEFSRKGKNLTDEEAIKVLKKISKDAEEVNSEQSLKEVEFLKNFIPEEMSQEDIVKALEKIIVDNNIERTKKNIGLLKKEFETQYSQSPSELGKLCLMAISPK